MDSTITTATAFVLLPSAPFVLVYVIGIIMASMNVSRYRRASEQKAA
jgi:hypothetical protein